MPVTRRQFIRDASLATGALTLGACTKRDAVGRPAEVAATPPEASQPAARSAALTAPPRVLGVALVGLGYYSTDLLAPALQLTRHCRLRGIVTGSPHKVPRWQSKYGISDRHVYDYASMDRIADDEDIDVVYIVLPTSLHAEAAIRAARAGKHVWCEKPMAMNVDDCRRVIDVCGERGVQLSIGYRMRHEPNTRTVMEYAERRPYGPIASVRAFAGYRGGGGGTGWRFDKAMGGGALYDMGVYAIDAIRYATGEEPTVVKRAVQSTTRPRIFTEVDETTEFELGFASGITAVGRTSVGENINELRVDCDDGWVELRPMQSYTGVEGRTSDGTRLDAPIENQQATQMDDDALAILHDTPAMVPGEVGLEGIRIVQAILECARTGAPVEIG